METLPLTRWSRGPIGPGWFMIIPEVKPPWAAGGGGGAAWSGRDADPWPAGQIRRPPRDHRRHVTELLAILLLDEE